MATTSTGRVRNSRAKSIGRTRNHNTAVQAEKKRRAFELRLQGLTHAQIGDHPDIQVAHNTISKWISDEIAARVTPVVEELRTLELAKLDLCDQAALGLLGRGGEIALKAIDRIVKVSERRARLTGLDAPVKIENSGPMSEADLALQELINEARARNAAVEAQLNTAGGE